MRARGYPALNLPPTKEMDRAEQATHDCATQGAFDKFFPCYWWKNSFFDDGVQTVLNEMHGQNARPELMANLILAWKTCDGAVLTQFQRPEKLVDFLRDTGSWGTRLLAMVQLYYETTGKRMREPQSLADLYRIWADKRYWLSSSLLRPLDPPEKYAEAVEEIRKTFKTVIRRQNLSITDNAIRQHLHKEKSKRSIVMDHWKQHWLAYERLILPRYRNLEFL